MADVVEKKVELPKSKLAPQATEKADVLAEIGVILTEFNNLESNIPPSHEYWDLLNRYRAL